VPFSRITTEDVSGLPDLRDRPEEISIDYLGFQPVAMLDPRKITPEMRADLARAIIDKAWPRVRGCEVYVTVTMERAKDGAGKIVAVPVTHLTAALFYSETRAR
jgi:hypothetical protein